MKRHPEDERRWAVARCDQAMEQNPRFLGGGRVERLLPRGAAPPGGTRVGI
jgi:hypothetical protein